MQPSQDACHALHRQKEELVRPISPQTNLKLVNVFASYGLLEFNSLFSWPYFVGLILLDFHQILRRMNLELSRRQKMVSSQCVYEGKHVHECF